MHELIKQEDKELGIDAHKWYGKEDRTEEEVIHDTGVGETVTIRLFEFKFPPTLKDLPTKEQILTGEYIRHLKTQLWGDGLRLVMDPEVVIEKDGCKVFAACQAAMGNNFLDKPKLLQEWIN